MRKLAPLTLLSLTLISATAATIPTTAPADLPTLRRQMAEHARLYHNLATVLLVRNRPATEQWPPSLLAELSRLRADLQTWSAAPLPNLLALLHHPDPKVRTLAVASIYLRDDPHDLPAIASLVADDAATYPLVTQTMRSQGGVRALPDLQHPQTVGSVARTFLAPYLVAAHAGGRGVDISDYRDLDGPRATQLFADYWKPRAARRDCASWIAVAIDRAARHTIPIAPEDLPNVRAALARLDALPPGERPFAMLFVRNKCFCLSDTDGPQPLPDQALLAALRALGPAPVLSFLQRKPVTPDPDLHFDHPDVDNDLFGQISTFLLRHAPDLLRPADAPAILACEQAERVQPQTLIGPSPYYPAAAAELTHPADPAAARHILDDALTRYPLAVTLGGRNQAVLMAAFWRMEGSAQILRLTDWFYQAVAHAHTSEDPDPNGPPDFLHELQAARRPDTPALLRSLVIDPRFVQTDGPTLKVFLELASSSRPQPLVPEADIYSGMNSEASRAQWRALLRQHYAASPRAGTPSKNPSIRRW